MKRQNSIRPAAIRAFVLILFAATVLGVMSGCEMVVEDLLNQSQRTSGIGEAVGTRGPAGGWIFYDDEADGVDDIPGYRYLEAAPYGWYNGGDDPRIQWGVYGYTVKPSATATGVGTGKTNTENIVSFHDSLDNAESVAAKVCAEYSVTVNGTVYDDWFLPSKGELNLIYENLHLQGVGRYSSDYYWSSSESSCGDAWKQYFNNGSQSNYSKGNVYPVRAVRAF
jgi:hypothetical protein